MTTETEDLRDLVTIDQYHGWHTLEDDPPNAMRGPSPPQQAVWDILAEAPPRSRTVVLYGGAAGGGKSNLLANAANEFALMAPGVDVLVARQAMVHLRPTTLKEFDESLDPAVWLRRYDSTPTYRQVAVPGQRPSTVWFRPMDDWQALMSAAYGLACVEEGQETQERAFLGLLSRLRHTAVQKWAAIVGFNPFPSWVTDWAFNGMVPKQVADDPHTFIHFVPSKIADNPFLDPDYEGSLRALYSNDPYMTAVLIDGVAEHVPNAVYEILNQPEMRALVQSNSLPGPDDWQRGATGWDWGTSVSHKSAGVLLAKTRTDEIWVLDAWESPLGSLDELKQIAESWTLKSPLKVKIARFDASQGSLKDDLGKLYSDTDKGVRDVDGRIRLGRSVIYGGRLRFNWRSEGARMLYRYLTLYHRDDEDRIVEEKDDMVDAFHYGLWGLENPLPSYEFAQKPTASAVTYDFAERSRVPTLRPRAGGTHVGGGV